MRILHVSKFYPPEPGGIETAVEELALAQVAAGHTVEVLCAGRSLRTSSEQPRPGLRVTRAGTLGSLASASMSPAMPGLLSAGLERADILHVHMPDPMAALAVRTADPRVPVVLHWHSDVVRQRLTYRLYEPLERWILGRADAVAATSLALSQSSRALRQWQSKVRPIALGITDPAAQECGGLDSSAEGRAGERSVFALGRMTWYKGFDVLIRAAALLPEDVKVVIAGEGPMRGRWRTLVARLGLQRRVEMPGAVSQAEARRLHAAADVFCLPSTARAEAFGLSMLEAMAHGRPVVSSRIAGSGVGWVNQDQVTGLAVTAGDPQALAIALQTVLDDPGLARRLGQAGRARFLECFTAQAMARGFDELYLEVTR